MPGHPPAEPQPLSLLLLRISEELHALQAEGRAIEDAIGHAILGGASSTRETLANLQSIDLIVQSLGELGDYVLALQYLLKEDPLIDASGPLERISLRDLARKLSGGCRRAVVDAHGEICGEVDLF